MKLDEKTYRLTESGRFGNAALLAAGLGLILCSIGYTNDTPQFYFAWLTGLAFWVTLGLGALFLTLIHHLTNATWSLVIRRMTESLALTLPLMFLFAIPLFFGIGELYEWSHTDEVAHDTLLLWKSGYLNVPFFVARTVAVFAIWSFLTITLYRLSVAQDAGFTMKRIAQMRKISAGGLILFAFTITMIGFDWLMSLEPHWYSTIYGVYFFTGSFLGGITLIIVLASYMRKKQVLDKIITVEHYHDLGKLALAFIVFWAYQGYSQYMLQWYGNIPEETFWYLKRWEGSWSGVSLFLFFGHFVAPFAILLFRAVKRNISLLRLVAFWILFMHYVDMYWLTYPTHLEQGPTFSLMELTTLVGPALLIGGVFCWFFWNRFTRVSLLPISDPRLKKSMVFVNS